MNEKLKAEIDGMDCSAISEARKERLMQVVNAIQTKVDANETVNLVFVCTHNSRRSQFAQIWSHIMAEYYSMHSVYSYSAGTEATAVYPSVLKTFEGDFEFESSIGESSNPFHLLKFGENSPAAICFSKTLEHSLNPKSNFIAVMTCSEADNGCPMVVGASHRISLPFEDPKKSDGNPNEIEVYSSTSKLIATELKFVFSKIQK